MQLHFYPICTYHTLYQKLRLWDCYFKTMATIHMIVKVWCKCDLSLINRIIHKALSKINYTTAKKEFSLSIYCHHKIGWLNVKISGLEIQNTRSENWFSPPHNRPSYKTNTTKHMDRWTERRSLILQLPTSFGLDVQNIWVALRVALQ